MSRPLLSPEYICHARANCFWLLRQEIWVAFCLARERAGRSIAAKIAMMAITTNNSMSVNAKIRRCRLNNTLLITRLDAGHQPPPYPKTKEDREQGSRSSLKVKFAYGNLSR